MNRRQVLKLSGGAAGLVIVGGFGPPACGVSKDKAVRYTAITIDYLEDVLPLVSQLGGTEMAALINKAIPALQKLKSALADADFPEAGNLFDTVTGTLGQIANALLQLPESPRRDTVMGILTLVNVTLLTVQLFIESEEPAAVTAKVRPVVRTTGKKSSAVKVRVAFEASRFPE